MSASGKNKSKSNRAKTASKKQDVSKEYVSLGEEIVLLTFIAVCIFLELSVFGLCGVVGDALSKIIFGLFGFISYIFPVYMFISAAFLVSNQYRKRAVKKVIYAGLLCIIASTFIQMFSGVEVDNVFTFYTQACTSKTGGGLIGGVLAYYLVQGAGSVGGYFILLVLTVILMVLLAEISFIDALKEQTGFMSVDANDERREKKRKNQENKRTEKKQGVEEGAKKKVHKAACDDPFHRNQKSGIDIGEALRVLPADANQNMTDKVVASGEISHPVVEEEIHEITMDFDSDDALDQHEEAVFPKEPKKRRVRKTKRSEQDMEEATQEVMQEIASSGGYMSAANEAKPDETPIVNVENDGGKNHYSFPPVTLLKQGKNAGSSSQDASVRETAVKLQQTLKNFGVNVTITNYSCGPAVTRYEMQPEQGVKVSKIVGLADDIKLNLAAADIRIEAPIPGKAAVGIEVPNKENSVVNFRDLVSSDKFKKAPSDITFAVGKDIGGQVVVTDIAKMPHLLIAGATGSGKSVCINTLIMSILYKAHPDDVKLIMIDPKMVELSVYNGIPHLLVPVVTDPKKAAGALNWAVMEMTNRYQAFAQYGVRNLKGYNEKIKEVIATDEVDPEKMPQKMPQIVVIVDELADLMMVAHGEVEDAIVRLSQLARAAGIHLVIATQRPSVDVITGLIKANVPSRIAFAVSSGVDSRTILDMVGAEKLLGKGDMLFYPTGYPKPVRVQGALVSDDEVVRVTDYIKQQNQTGDYDSQIVSQMDQAVSAAALGKGDKRPGDERDDYFVDAGKFIIEKNKASIGLLQRVYKIGFNRAARLMDQLADAGVVGPEEGTKPRKVLMSLEEFEQYIEEYV